MLLSFKTILITISVIAVLAFGWGIGNGYITWSKTPYKCFGGVHYYAAVPKQQWLSIGPLHAAYQPFTWGCDPDHRYSPERYHVENGELVGN